MPSPTPSPAPTPTPVPLPKTCLRQAFADDVSHCESAPSYEIDLQVDLEAVQVTGQQVVRYANNEQAALDDLYLQLLPNTPNYGGTMTVTQITLRGQPVTPTVEREGTALHFPLDPPLAAGEALTLSAQFVIDVPTVGYRGHALFSYRRGVMALPTAYAIIPVYDDEGWNIEIAPEYGDDLYADIALYTVHIEAPADQTLIASGSCTQPGPGRWTCDAAPMREFVFIVGDNYRRASRIVNGVVVNSYYYTQHEAGGQRALEVAADALLAFTEDFGPYPYAELDVVETPNRLGGMEYPGLVVVEDGLYPGVGGVEWLTAHEVAHQWWFAVVGNDQIDEPWLDESLTQYSTMLYYEATYGPERAQGVLNGEFVATHQSLKRRGWDLPAGLPASEYSPSTYWQVVYDKGALYFHALRERLGDETFFRVLQTYYERHRYQIATPGSFLSTLRSVTGDGHEDLFKEWIGEEELPQ
jgi:hypothetical protein